MSTTYEERTAIRAKIEKFIEENDLEVPIGYFSHAIGLPSEPGALNGTNRPATTADVEALYIGATKVWRCTLRCPFNYNDWSCSVVFSYSTPEELKSFLEKQKSVEKGCW
jgi:hypothetical protein